MGNSLKHKNKEQEKTQKNLDKKQTSCHPNSVSVKSVSPDSVVKRITLSSVDSTDSDYKIKKYNRGSNTCSVLISKDMRDGSVQVYQIDLDIYTTSKTLCRNQTCDSVLVR